jgi:hypothetical protein
VTAVLLSVAPSVKRRRLDPSGCLSYLPAELAGWRPGAVLSDLLPDALPRAEEGARAGPGRATGSRPASPPPGGRLGGEGPHFFPMQYRALLDRMSSRPSATAGVESKSLRSLRSLVASSSNRGRAATTCVRPSRPT